MFELQADDYDAVGYRLQLGPSSGWLSGEASVARGQKLLRPDTSCTSQRAPLMRSDSVGKSCLSGRNGFAQTHRRLTGPLHGVEVAPHGVTDRGNLRRLLRKGEASPPSCARPATSAHMPYPEAHLPRPAGADRSIDAATLRMLEIQRGSWWLLLDCSPTLVGFAWDFRRQQSTSTAPSSGWPQPHMHLHSYEPERRRRRTRESLSPPRQGRQVMSGALGTAP